MNKILKISKGQGEQVQVLSDTVTIKASGKDSDGALTIVEVICPPGGGPPVHRHPSAETFYVLSGILSVSVQHEGQLETVDLSAGDTINIRSMQWHGYRNNSDEPVCFLAMLTPAGMEDFFRELGQPISSEITPSIPAGPPSPEEQERILSIIHKYVEVQLPA